MCNGMVAPKIHNISQSFSFNHGLLLRFAVYLGLCCMSEVLTSGCPRPASISNGSVNATVPYSRVFAVGTVLQYRCNLGYSLRGSSIIRCTETGQWYTDLPFCTKTDDCPQPPEPENGGFTCHPSPCRKLVSKTVIEYFCDEGYTLKGDYKYLTCQNGEWNPAMEISCRLSHGKDTQTIIGAPTLSIVAATASSVILILLLVVLFVLLQPKLKSFHHNRRDQGVSREQLSITVDGVQVALPSYEEAVYGSAGNCIPPSDSRVQIVLSEGPSASGMQLQPELAPRGPSLEDSVPGHSAACEASGSHLSETVLVHQEASSSWASGPMRRPAHVEPQDSENSDVQSLLSMTCSEDFTDDIPLLKEA
ncbi:sushi domain-containing protein 6 isoform X1 [Latimeria chalumnae]|uniref:sushi domain-containing protein 6 isoform X1 n=1 Tax=Latimeria chalumnae TaxID=7897 RepID=UPI00313F01F6